MSRKPPLPLKNLTVVAVEQAVAAPLATARLADAGARVIKIERPEGDFARGYDNAAKGQSSYFVWLNRGKTSILADLRSEKGREKLESAIAGADILVQNLKPGSLSRLGFDPEALALKYPGLIICSISGYGEDGPLSLRKSYDLLIQAETGLSSLTGGPQEPARVGFSVVDVATGETAYAAILEAVINKEKTGQGAVISVSLFDVMAEWLTVPLLNHEAGNSPQRVGLAHPSIAPYGVFTTKDGKDILISIQNDREWFTLCDIFIGNVEYANDQRFKTNVNRAENREETDALVSGAFATRTEKEATALLEEADIAFAGVNNMEDLSNHPHLRRITVETPSGPVSYPAPAPIFSGAKRSYGRVPDLPEEDT